MSTFASPRRLLILVFGPALLSACGGSASSRGPVPPAPADVQGLWIGEAVESAFVVRVLLQITQTGDVLSGTYEDSEGQSGPVAGTVSNGTQVSLTADVHAPADPYTVVFDGTVGPSGLAGTLMMTIKDGNGPGVDRPFTGPFDAAQNDALAPFLSTAVFVATWGADASGPLSGLSPVRPLLTVQAGLTEAQASARGAVLVQAGNYAATVDLLDGSDLRGGFDARWIAGDPADVDHQVTLTGGLHGPSQESMTVRAVSLTTAAAVSDLRIQAPDAVGAGKSSYGVYLNASPLTLLRVEILGGAGAPGQNGVDGTAAPQTVTAVMTGGPGGDGGQNIGCDAVSRGVGGVQGLNPGYVSGASPSGGLGGAGGKQDTSCSIPQNLNATGGQAGANAASVAGMNGRGGSGGPANSFTPGGGGQDGVSGTAGAAGAGGTLVSLNGGFSVSEAGEDGGLGENGGGGGGGGGAGGNDGGTDAYGAGGGGGGAGGLAAPTAGGGGTGGGSSFGVFAVSSTGLVVTDCVIVRGAGAIGGAGGAGGAGQPGGPGGPPGTAVGAAAAGAGGGGGAGSASGGGGGGRGGDAVGIRTHSSTTTITNVQSSGGTAGAGGSGGSGAGAGQAGQLVTVEQN